MSAFRHVFMITISVLVLVAVIGISFVLLRSGQGAVNEQHGVEENAYEAFAEKSKVNAYNGTTQQGTVILNLMKDGEYAFCISGIDGDGDGVADPRYFVYENETWEDSMNSGRDLLDVVSDRTSPYYLDASANVFVSVVDDWSVSEVFNIGGSALRTLVKIEY